MEDSVPLSTNKIRKRNKHFKSAKSLSKRKIESSTSSDESDDLQGFIVNDDEEDDIMDEIEEEKPEKKGTRKRESKTKSKAKNEEDIDIKKETTTRKRKPAEKKEIAPVVEKRKVTGSYRPKWLGPERDPPKHGSKPIPVGKPDCLSQIPFVLTGLNESLTRDETIELITKYGGLVRTAISGKTKYLVAGFEMEDGRPIEEGSKYKAAKAKGVKIINEDDLLDLIRQSNPEGSAKAEVQQILAKEEERMNDLKSEELIMKDHQQITSSRLLTVKYAPTNSQEILGNKDILNNLRLWLTQWDDVIINRKNVLLLI